MEEVIETYQGSLGYITDQIYFDRLAREVAIEQIGLEAVLEADRLNMSYPAYFEYFQLYR